MLDGKYQLLEPNSDGWLSSQQLSLFLGIYQQKLRFFTSEGEIVLTHQEVAQLEAQRADRETQRAQLLAAKL